jgi:hypothetical protein
METPLAEHRDALVTGRVDLDDWRSYRAIALLLMLQPARSSAALEHHDHRNRLAELLRLPDDQLDQLIVLWLDKHRLVRYAIPSEERLYFPSTGVFALPVVDSATPQHFDFAFAVPIHPRVFIARLSETAEIDGLAQRAERGMFHSAVSVGLHSDFVVLPPDVLGGNSEEHICNVLPFWRNNSRELVQNMVMARTLMKAAWDRFGVKLDTSFPDRQVIESHDERRLAKTAG